MKKKLFALVMSAMMLCGLATTAMAAPSVQVEAAPAVAQAVTASGKVIAKEDLAVTAVKDVTKLPTAVAEKLEKAHQEIVSAPSIENFLKDAGIQEDVEKAVKAVSSDVKTEDLTIHSMFDVSASGAAKEELEAHGSVTISFDVPELKAGQVAVVLHMGANGWEVVPSAIKNGVVSATFTSLSPVVVMVEEAAAAPAAAWAMESPQTGYATGMLVSAAALSAGALVLSLKRREEV